MSSKRTRETYSYAGTIFKPGEPVPGAFEKRGEPVPVVDVFYERKMHERRMLVGNEAVDANIQQVEIQRYQLVMNWIPEKMSSDYWLVDDMGDKFNFVKVDDTDPHQLMIEAIMEPYTGAIEISPYPYVPRRSLVIVMVATVADEFGVAVADEFGNMVVGEMP